MIRRRFHFTLLLLPWLAFSARAAPSSSADSEAPPPDSRMIDEARFVSIGGIEQWITIKGESRDNPVVLFVHGGPGNPMSAWSRSLYQDWEESFAVVQWDQRYAGRTYERNEPAVELTMERFEESELTIDLLVRDGIEVAEHLLRRLGRQKLILTGTSWGSVLGIHMAKARPDLFHAYVGVSQIVNYEEMLAASYQSALEGARARSDAAAQATLESLGPPPWENPRNFGQLRRILRNYERETTSAYPDLVAAPEYDTDAYREAYVAGEDLSFLKFVGLKNDGMAANIDLPELGLEFEIPVFFIQGAEDLLTVPELVEAYFERIEAPEKDFLLVPQAGHDPNIAMIEAHLKLMKERVAPLIR